MKTFQMRIITPEGVQFDGEAVSVILRTVDGDMGIYAGHIPCTAALGNGAVRLRTAAGEQKGHCAGGIAAVEKDGVRILTERFDWDEG